MIQPLHVFKVKAPAESIGRCDDYKVVMTVPGDQAYRPLADSHCPLLQK
ncbi:hypothetical protein FHS85_002656 [Rhodoligotrophos appendicifer]|nr:hypothetical protein [Rhodoligotrophos appendicifer]